MKFRLNFSLGYNTNADRFSNGEAPPTIICRSFPTTNLPKIYSKVYFHHSGQLKPILRKRRYANVKLAGKFEKSMFVSSRILKLQISPA